jgi:hypothetical protein
MNVTFNLLERDDLINITATVIGHSQSNAKQELWTLSPTGFWSDGDDYSETASISRLEDHYRCAARSIYIDGTVSTDRDDITEYGIRDIQWNTEFKAPPASTDQPL